MRTITQFTSKVNKVYFFFKNTDICKQFYQQAQAEGITFGGMNPTEKAPTDLIALLPSGELCYVGWAGRICYHNCGADVIRIDYERYVGNASDYLIRR